MSPDRFCVGRKERQQKIFIREIKGKCQKDMESIHLKVFVLLWGDCLLSLCLINHVMYSFIETIIAIFGYYYYYSWNFFLYLVFFDLAMYALQFTHWLEMIFFYNINEYIIIILRSRSFDLSIERICSFSVACGLFIEWFYHLNVRME